MKIGIVGLPNVGKSTLFNAFLGRQQALCANYPFATIEPNVGVVSVPDDRVDVLSNLSNSEKKVYATITFVDIAGLVEGANKGEGLGNQFLANIREVDLILVLLRDFNDVNIVREGSIDPKHDFEIIKTELILKDLETIEKQAIRSNKANPSKEEIIYKSTINKLKDKLINNDLAINAVLTDEEAEVAKTIHLLTSKKFIKVVNVTESDIARLVNSSNVGDNYYISAKIESELSVLSTEDQKLYLSELGLKEDPLNKIIRVCFEMLNLRTFLTTGKQESRAWKFNDGMNARECAGIIHTDFFDNFIKAEVISYDDYIKYKSKIACRDAGKLRLEGKEYIMKEGDVVEFKIGSS